MSARTGEALGYAAEQGWPVFPVNGKTPLTPQGFKNATTDEVVIERWWGTDHPGANIGVRTGSGLVVVDVDERHGGFDSLHELNLPDTVSSVTGGGGAHLWMSTDKYVRSRTNVWPGIDVKAVGGYVVAPSSIHPSGGIYEWDNPPQEVDLAPVPAWLLDKLSGRRRPKPLPTVIPVSERNDTLISLAGYMARKGLTEEEILITLTGVSSRRCEGVFSGAEVAKIARSAAKYHAHPWALDPWSYASRVGREYELGVAACLVLNELYRMADDKGDASMGYRLLSTKTRLAPGTVVNAVQTLAAHGLITQQSARGKRSVFRLSPNPLPPKGGTTCVNIDTVAERGSG